MTPQPAPTIAVSTDGDRFALFPVEENTEVPRQTVDARAVADIETNDAPRWVWWDQDTARRFVANDIRPVRCWDLSAVHRLVEGGWRCEPARVWAAARGLPADDVPRLEAPTLFNSAATDEPDRPIRPDGHLNPEWAATRWSRDDASMQTWTELAGTVFDAQRIRAAERAGSERPAHAESAAGLLCAELEHDGLPIDQATAEAIITEFIGPRPRTATEAARRITERDELVVRHLPPDAQVDLRNPAHVKSMLRRAGIEVADTRARRLEALREEHPIVDALLRWRKAERIATTFGYQWLDEHVADDGRLHGEWSPSDGAAGRMTATAGLHNLASLLRPAVMAEPGYQFVRADLGQIEPRVLAAVSGDSHLVRATEDDDLYAPVALRLGVDREIAKVAVLGAMYGQTTGHGAAALAGLEREYPVAMDYLRAADHAAQGGRDVFTVGGRRVRMDATATGSEQAERARAAARGRYGRNAVVQGSAAEFFKTWAALVRARCAGLDARIVLCLHDELLVHVAEHDVDRVADIVRETVGQVTSQWGPSAAATVRFVADVSVIRRWSDAK